MSKQTELAQIHIAKKDLGMEDDAYRALLMSVAKVDSSAKLDFHGRMAVIQRMKDLGWQNKRKPSRTGPVSRKRTSPADKIRALWIDMADLGIIKDRSESALMAYIKRMTKGQYLAPQFCDTQTASQLIETLKKWKYRAIKEQEKAKQGENQ